MAKYKVVEPGPIQAGRAWQVGDEVELDDAQAEQYSGKVERVAKRPVKLSGTNAEAAVKAELKSEPEGDGE